MLEQELAEFGRRLGLGRLTPPPSGPLSLEIGELGLLSLETLDGGGVLISLAVPLPVHDRGRLVRTLRLCAPDQGQPWPLACGLRRDHLIFLIRLPQAGLTAADLENAARFLLETARKTETA